MQRPVREAFEIDFGEAVCADDARLSKSRLVLDVVEGEVVVARKSYLIVDPGPELDPEWVAHMNGYGRVKPFMRGKDEMLELCIRSPRFKLMTHFTCFCFLPDPPAFAWVVDFVKKFSSGSVMRVEVPGGEGGVKAIFYTQAFVATRLRVKATVAGPDMGFWRIQVIAAMTPLAIKLGKENMFGGK
jgi:hypothetical protein